MERTVGIAPGERLQDCQTKNAAVVWPLPLDNLLDDLVDLADAAGMTTTRKELAAAIILAAPRDGAKLSKLIVNYRTSKVADVRGAPSGDNVIDFTIRKPGPRARRGSAG